MKARLAVACSLGILGALLGAQTFRERVSVELVRVELLATDARGRALAALGPAEIQVKVDGRPVKIESFEAPPPPELPALPPAPASRAPAPPAQAAPVPAATTPHRPYFMAFLVDETSSEQSNRRATLGQLFQFLQKGLPPDVEVLLMRFNGVLRVECPWTRDVERLRRGAAALTERRAVSLLGAPGQISDNPEQGSYKLELDAMEALMHVRTSLAGLFDGLRQFPETPGRKALFFITDGAPFLTPAEIARDLIATSTSNDGVVPRTAHEGEYDRDLLVDSLAWNRMRGQSLLTDIARLALLRDVEIHPVRSAAHDLDGRVRTDRAFRGRAALPADPRRSVRDTNSVPTTDIAAGQGMEAMAEATGGEAVLSRRMFEDEIQREVTTRDSAYALTFRDPFAGDHRFHRIEISLARSGTKLRYRRGYRILETRESLVERTVNRLHIPADDNPLGVRLQLNSLGVENGIAVAEITVAYPAPPEAGGGATGTGAVQLIGICAVRDGALSEPIDLSGKAERASMSDSTWLVRSGRVRLKPGAYRWSFAIRDEQTGITSYLTFDRRLP